MHQEGHEFDRPSPKEFEDNEAEVMGNMVPTAHASYVMRLRHVTFSVLSFGAAFHVLKGSHAILSRLSREHKRNYKTSVPLTSLYGPGGEKIHKMELMMNTFISRMREDEKKRFRSKSVHNIFRSMYFTRTGENGSTTVATERSNTGFENPNRIELHFGHFDHLTNEFNPLIDIEKAEIALERLHKCENCIHSENMSMYTDYIHSINKERAITTRVRFHPGNGWVSCDHFGRARYWTQHARPIENEKSYHIDEGWRFEHREERTEKYINEKKEKEEGERKRAEHFPDMFGSIYGSGSSTSSLSECSIQTNESLQETSSKSRSRRKQYIKEACLNACANANELSLFSMPDQSTDVRVSIVRDHSIPKENLPQCATPVEVSHVCKQSLDFLNQDTVWRYTFEYIWRGETEEEAEYAFWTEPYKVRLSIEPLNAARLMQNRSRIHHPIFLASSMLCKAADLMVPNNETFQFRTLLRNTGGETKTSRAPGSTGEIISMDNRFWIPIRGNPEPPQKDRSVDDAFFEICWSNRRRRISKKRDRDRAKTRYAKKRITLSKHKKGNKEKYKPDSKTPEIMYSKKNDSPVTFNWNIAESPETTTTEEYSDTERNITNKKNKSKKQTDRGYSPPKLRKSTRSSCTKQ